MKALDGIREAHDVALQTTEAWLRLHTLLQTPSSKANKTALLSQARDLLTIVGNQSNLILDPDLDSYCVMSLTVLRFPELLQVLYDTRAFMQHWGQTSQGKNPRAQLPTLVGGLDDAWRVGLEQMQQLLNGRVDGLFQRMWLHLGTALLLLGCILSLVYLVASQIARPLQALARVADDVRHTADYTRRAHWHSRDEIGHLFTAFNSMLAQLDHDRLAQQELAASACRTLARWTSLKFAGSVARLLCGRCCRRGGSSSMGATPSSRRLRPLTNSRSWSSAWSCGPRCLKRPAKASSSWTSRARSSA